MRKNKYLMIRISEKDVKMVKETAQKLDMTVSEFVRIAIMNEIKKIIKKGEIK